MSGTITCTVVFHSGTYRDSSLLFSGTFTAQNSAAGSENRESKSCPTDEKNKGLFHVTCLYDFFLCVCVCVCVCDGYE